MNFDLIKSYMFGLNLRQQQMSSKNLLKEISTFFASLSILWIISEVSKR